MSLKKKRELKSPLQYKKGFIKFLGCRINLSKKPFIPRIETEYWVGKAIKEIKKDTRYKIQDIRILDMFAGSGCIGVAILKVYPKLCQRVDFVDSDRRAISQIKINLVLNKISPKKYKIYSSNFFAKLKSRTYDIIFANPPYVAEERTNEVQESVLEYEPKKALFSGKKGLNHIKRFLKEAKRFLKQEGIIYLEFDPRQKKEIEKILEKNGYKNYKIFKDQFKKYRWLKIVKSL